MNATPPEIHSLPVLQHIFDLTVLWHSITTHFPKRERFSVGERVLTQLINALSTAQDARFTPNKNEKITFLTSAIRSLNSAIILVRLCNEIGALPDKQYFEFSTKLVSYTKMLGGWKRDTLNPKIHAS